MLVRVLDLIGGEAIADTLKMGREGDGCL